MNECRFCIACYVVWVVMTLAMLGAGCALYALGHDTPAAWSIGCGLVFALFGSCKKACITPEAAARWQAIDKAERS